MSNHKSKSKGDWRSRFLKAFERSADISQSARAAGISRMTFYRHCDSDPDFAGQFEQLRDGMAEDLTGAAYRRAVYGVRHPVYYKGAVVGSRRRYSDRLTIFLLAKLRPDVYGTSSPDRPADSCQAPDGSQARSSGQTDRSLSAEAIQFITSDPEYRRALSDAGVDPDTAAKTLSAISSVIQARQRRRHSASNG